MLIKKGKVKNMTTKIDHGLHIHVTHGKVAVNHD